MELCVKCKRRARISEKWLEIEPDEYFMKLAKTEPVVLSVCLFCFKEAKSEAITHEIMLENLHKRQLIEGQAFTLLE